MSLHSDLDPAFAHDLPASLPDGQPHKIVDIAKPSIFIGCSRESLPIARKVKELLRADHFEVDVWDEGIFGKTRSNDGEISNTEYLKNFSDIYDYAIFLFVPEDELKSLTRRMRGSGEAARANATRHNVIFEFGLFLGRIGAKRSFILYDRDTQDFVDLFFTDFKENTDDTQIVSDEQVDTDRKFRLELYPYQGHYQEYIASAGKRQPYDEASLQAAVAKIEQRVYRTFEDVDIHFLPSTSLAIGYYNNFLKIIISSLADIRMAALPEAIVRKMKENAEIEKTVLAIRRCRTVRFHVAFPDSLDMARHPDFKPRFENTAIFRKISLPGITRDLTTYCEAKGFEDDAETFVIYDVPTTMNSSIEAIKMTTEHADIRQLLFEKERRNFRKALDALLDQAAQQDFPSIRETVSVIGWEDFLRQTEQL